MNPLRNPVALELSAASPSSSAQAPVVAASGPGQFEVGVLDGTHGWLQIRAELAPDGTVGASLTAAATAQDALHRSVPEMASYLQSESVHVGAIAVHRLGETANALSTAEYSASQSGSGQGGRANAGSQQDDRQGARQSSNVSRAGDTDAVPNPSTSVSDATSPGSGWLPGISPTMFGLVNASQLALGSGTWLNVQA